MTVARNLPHSRPKVDRHSEAETGNTVPERRATIRIISGTSGQSIGRPRKLGKIKGQNSYRAPSKGGFTQMNKGTARLLVGVGFFAKLDSLVATRQFQMDREARLPELLAAG